MNSTATFFAFALAMLTQLSVIGVVHSAAIGMPESTLRVGYGIGLGDLSIDDPNGPTASKRAFQPFRIIVTDWFRGDIRYWGEFYYQDVTLSASQVSIGQKVNQYGLQLSAQKNFIVNTRWSPWLGVGVDLSQNKYSSRHTVDGDGFLQSRFADRSETDLGIILNLVSEAELNREWEMGVKLEQRLTITDGIDQLSLSVFVLNHF